MELHFRKYGDAPTPLIILHGLLGSHKNWHSVAQYLADEYTIIVPDLRNHGQSSHGRHSIANLSDDIFDLFQKFAIDKAFLIGHSMGGLAAMDFSFRHPECLIGLIVVDIAPEANWDGSQSILGAMRQIDLFQLQSKQDAGQQLSKDIPNPMIRDFLLQNLKRENDGSYSWWCNLPELHRFVGNERRAQFNENTKFYGATLFVGGGLSEQRISEKQNLILRHFPNSEIVMIPKSGHWVHSETKTEFLKLVTSFMNGVAQH